MQKMVRCLDETAEAAFPDRLERCSLPGFEAFQQYGERARIGHDRLRSKQFGNRAALPFPEKLC